MTFGSGGGTFSQVGYNSFTAASANEATGVPATHPSTSLWTWLPSNWYNPQGSNYTTDDSLNRADTFLRLITPTEGSCQLTWSTENWVQDVIHNEANIFSFAPLLPNIPTFDIPVQQSGFGVSYTRPLPTTPMR